MTSTPPIVHQDNRPGEGGISLVVGVMNLENPPVQPRRRPFHNIRFQPYYRRAEQAPQGEPSRDGRRREANPAAAPRGRDHGNDNGEGRRRPPVVMVAPGGDDFHANVMPQAMDLLRENLMRAAENVIMNFAAGAANVEGGIPPERNEPEPEEPEPDNVLANRPEGDDFNIPEDIENPVVFGDGDN